MEERRCVGVALAGGASRRMGTSKAALEIGGEPLLRRVARRLKEALPEVVVIGAPELETLVTGLSGVQVAMDLRPGLGPLAGLETALTVCDAEWIFAVACDMPFVAPPLVEAMTRIAKASQDVDVVALRTESGIEYLHAVYARSSLLVITEQLNTDDLALRDLFARLRVREMAPEVVARYDPRGLSAFNANAPADWERALTLAALQQSPQSE